jgi:hypothetical protein
MSLGVFAAPSDDAGTREIVIEDRLCKRMVGTTAYPDADYLAVYDYDDTTARMTQVTGPGLHGLGIVRVAMYSRCDRAYNVVRSGR